MQYFFIIVPMLCYMAQGVMCFLGNDKSHALIWFSYALANVGFITYEMSK